ncbi:TetR/AcrR family transcriptional regulator [Humibacter antri]
MTTLDAPPPTQRARGPRGSYAKTEAKRNAILDAALEVFAESGYRAGSIREIADRVGMSEAGMLHHFPSKRALLAAVLERRDAQSVGEERIITPGDARHTIENLIAIVEYNAARPGVVELYATIAAEATSTDHPAHAYFLHRYEWSRAAITAAFTDLHATGELREGVQPEIAANNVLALMDGLQIQWLLNRQSIDMVQQIRAYLAGIVTFDV